MSSVGIQFATLGLGVAIIYRMVLGVSYLPRDSVALAEGSYVWSD
jgi:hypothetical protein